MFELSKIDEARDIGVQIFAEGVARELPLALAHSAVKSMVLRLGLPVPEDILAFVSKGKTSDSMVGNWSDPLGDIIK